VAADALVLKVREAGRTVNVHALLATGVNADGYREILGLHVTSAEDGAGWLAFFRDLTARGLAGVALVVRPVLRNPESQVSVLLGVQNGRHSPVPSGQSVRNCERSLPLADIPLVLALSEAPAVTITAEVVLVVTSFAAEGGRALLVEFQHPLAEGHIERAQHRGSPVTQEPARDR